MESCTFSDLSFRDLYHRFALVDFPVERLADMVDVPADADGALVYGYVDVEAGLSLELLAPACVATGAVFHDQSFAIAQNKRVTVRSGSVSPAARVVFLDDQADDLAKRYDQHLDMIRTYFDGTPDIQRVRAIEELDPLRNRDYPDDVLVYLVSDGLPTEGVWFRLLGSTDDGMLIGTLLNEPDAGFSVHKDDVMALMLLHTPDGAPVLSTRPNLLIESK
jgi:hypothetical protein